MQTGQSNRVPRGTRRVPRGTCEWGRAACASTGVRPLVLIPVASLAALLALARPDPVVPRGTRTVAAPVRVEAPTPRPSAPTFVPPLPQRPAPAPATPRSVSAESVLEALDEGGALDAAGEIALRAVLDDAAADVPLRAGALYALLDARGRAEFPHLCELLGRPDAAPLWPVAAQAFARGCGPDDAHHLAALLDASERLGETRARSLAAGAAVLAATRDAEDEPTRLGAVGPRVLATLQTLVTGDDAVARRDALDDLARLGRLDPEATRLLEARALEAPDAEERLDAALLLRGLDARRAERALEALAECDDPRVKARLAALRE